MSNLEKLSKERDEFKRYFKVDLYFYMNPITGFDLCRFERDIKVPVNVSMSGFIAREYGEKARDLILRLI